MDTKMFEVRDRGTFIPVLAVKLEYVGAAERYLFARSGYGVTTTDSTYHIVLWKMGDGNGRATSDPWGWNEDSRTMGSAHYYIKENWDALDSGAVIDVEFILGETKVKKISKRLLVDSGG